MNWADYAPYFREVEFTCKHSGKCLMDKAFMDSLLKLRLAYGPMLISSGYRDKTHPIEAKKAAPGAHASGLACDIGVQGEEAHRLLGLALEVGFTGIGVQQKGTGRFLHLDTLEGDLRPTVWSY